MLQGTLSKWLKKASLEETGGTSITCESRGSFTAANDNNSSRDSYEGQSGTLAFTTSVETVIPIATEDPARNLPKLRENITITTCTTQDIQAFRRLNSLLLPIPYPESFYTETINDTVIASVTRLAFWQEDATLSRLPSQRLVAAIRCRILQSSPARTSSDPGPSLYISTITTLAPYRQYGLATHLLASVTRSAVELYGVVTITAHVWEANDEALNWYQRRGFTVVCKEDGYYRRLAPRTAAWVVQKQVKPSDIVRWK